TDRRLSDFVAEPYGVVHDVDEVGLVAIERLDRDLDAGGAYGRGQALPAVDGPLPLIRRAPRAGDFADRHIHRAPGHGHAGVTRGGDARLEVLDRPAARIRIGRSQSAAARNDRHRGPRKPRAVELAADGVRLERPWIEDRNLDAVESGRFDP